MKTTRLPKEQEFPKTVTVKGIPGIEAKIYRQDRTKKGKGIAYILFYVLLGKRKMQSFADLEKAKAAGEAAIEAIANGQQQALTLDNEDRHVYLRSKELLKKFNLTLDAACSECADVRTILNGLGSPVEAARFFVKHHSKELPRIPGPNLADH